MQGATELIPKDQMSRSPAIDGSSRAADGAWATGIGPIPTPRRNFPLVLELSVRFLRYKM
jgi:hypothetical protein